MVSEHHAALRAAGAVPALCGVLAPGSRAWAEVRLAARQALVHLGEIPDLDRPLAAFTPPELAALLRGQGIDVSAAPEGRVWGLWAQLLGMYLSAISGPRNAELIDYNPIPCPPALQASRFEARCLGGAELLSATDADLRSAVPAAQYPRLLRLLRAHEAFDDLDSAGERAPVARLPTFSICS